MNLNRPDLVGNLRTFFDRIDVSGYFGIADQMMRIVADPDTLTDRYDHIVIGEIEVDGVKLPATVIEVMWVDGRVFDFCFYHINITPPEEGWRRDRHAFYVDYTETAPDVAEGERDWLALAKVVNALELPDAEKESIIAMLRIAHK